MLAVDFGNLDDRDVKGTATEVEDRDLRVAALLVHAISKRRSGRLVDDAFDIETRDLAGVLGRLALRIVEVGRHRDNGFGDLFTEVILSRLLHFHQHARGNLGRRHLLALCLDPGVAVVRLRDRVRHHLDIALHDVVFETTTDQALDRKQRVGRIRHGLALGRLANQHLVVLGERNDRRRRAIAFAVFDDLGRIAFHHCYAGVGGTKVDTNNFTHDSLLQNLLEFLNWLLGGAAFALSSNSAHFLLTEIISAYSAATITIAGRSRRPFSV